MHQVLTGIGIKIQGHLKILEYASHQDYVRGHSRVVLNKRNAVHKENAAITIAKAIANHANGTIAYMVFGNGGSTVDPTGTVIFNSPHDTGITANLYNPVFFQLVDDTLGALPGNQMAARHISNSMFTDVDIRCLIGVNEPFGQLPSNIGTGINLNTNTFVFDEIGLKLIDGTLLTHVVFTPVLKTANTLLEVIYTLRIAVGQPLPPPPHEDIFLEGVEAIAHQGSLIEDIGASQALVGLAAASAGGDITIPNYLTCHHPSTIHYTTMNMGMTVIGGNVVGRELAQNCTLTSGRFYFEVKMDSGASGDACGIGIALPTSTEIDIGNAWTGGIGYRTNGSTFGDGAPIDILLPTISPGQTLGIAVDTVLHKIWFGINFTLTPASTGGFGPSVNFGAKNFNSIVSTSFELTIEFPPNTSDRFSINNGDTPFAFSPPIGFGYGWGGSIPNEGSYSTFDVVNSVNVNFFSDDFAAQGNGGNNGVRSTGSYSAGKHYFEFSTSQLVWNGGWVAIIDGVQSVVAGLTAHAVGISNIGNPNGVVHNDTYGQIAVDFTAKLLWIRGQNSDNWNNNALANPATGVGGLSLAALTPPYYFGMSAGGPNTQSYIFISNPAYFYYPVPAGFTPGF